MNTPSLPRRLPVAAGLCLLTACGSDMAAPGGGGPAISVAVVPSTASLLTSGTQDFTATVSNDPSNGGVTWSITGCSGGPAACGSLSNVTSTTATYTAPASVPPGAIGVTATSVSDATKAFGATVTVMAIAASGQIAFVSDRDHYEEIYVMSSDGSGVSQLTNAHYDHSPAWSPDGAKLAFVSTRDGHAQIYLMNADGSGVVRLTNDPGRDFYPHWSPDGPTPPTGTPNPPGRPARGFSSRATAMATGRSTA